MTGAGMAASLAVLLSLLAQISETRVASGYVVGKRMSKSSSTSSLDSGRHCQTLSLTSREPRTIRFESLPEAQDGRLYVPFSVRLGPAPGTPSNFSGLGFFRIYVGTGDDTEEDDFYIITIGEKELAIAKQTSASNYVKVLERAKMPLKQIDALAYTGFFFRTKERADYTSVALYNGGEEGSEPLISAKDEEANTGLRMTHVGYVLKKTSSPSIAFKADVLHNCRSRLKAFCLHSVECSASGSICLPHGKEAVCDCDEDHVADAREIKCKDNPIKLGEQCQNSRQCARLDAKCRLNENTGLKTCRCLNDHEENKHGICQEVRDRGELDWRRLAGYNKPEWSHMNPGRKKINPAGHNVQRQLLPFSILSQPVVGHSPRLLNDGTVRVKSHCEIGLFFNGMRDYPTPSLPRRYFPLPWHRGGFSLGFFVKGQGSLRLQLNHGGQIDRQNEPYFEVDLAGNKVEVKVGQQFVHVKSVFADAQEKEELQLIDTDHSRDYKVAVACRAPPSADSCQFTLGRSGIAPLLNLSIDNPWYMASGSTADNHQPTHFSFLPGSKQTSLSVMSLCTAGHGERCSDDSDCQKTHRDMRCVREYGAVIGGNSGDVTKCRCPKDRPEWSKVLNRCK